MSGGVGLRSEGVGRVSHFCSALTAMGFLCTASAFAFLYFLIPDAGGVWRRWGRHDLLPPVSQFVCSFALEGGVFCWGDSPSLGILYFVKEFSTEAAGVSYMGEEEEGSPCRLSFAWLCLCRMGVL